ncbi:hypothetical protein PoB_003514400 [Plakobranchus ocellatus]|uniref:Uncharacterized protein n=1 Tax=Plakobranchus ocellatus TaxID=259542 RepID=A0AAV4AR52_9GAST|nr:hypothetical protein PoB_003514400 [Plakobranchus ocellatus]
MKRMITTAATTNNENNNNNNSSSDNNYNFHFALEECLQEDEKEEEEEEEEGEEETEDENPQQCDLRLPGLRQDSNPEDKWSQWIARRTMKNVLYLRVEVLLELEKPHLDGHGSSPAQVVQTRNRYKI